MNTKTKQTAGNGSGERWMGPDSSLPTYYSILTAEVRYHKKLCSSAKLLYSEITALTGKSGYCYSSNGYFCRIFSTTERSVQSWLNQLAENGLITVEFPPKELAYQRRIYLNNAMHPPQKTAFTPPQKTAHTILRSTVTLK